MSRDESALRFEEVSFEYGHNKPILDTVDFSVRRNAKVAIMGQNGAGKTTLFGLMTGAAKPESGRVLITHGVSIATASQVIPREKLEMTVLQFFESFFDKKVYDIDPKIDGI